MSKLIILSNPRTSIFLLLGPLCAFSLFFFHIGKGCPFSSPCCTLVRVVVVKESRWSYFRKKNKFAKPPKSCLAFEELLIASRITLHFRTNFFSKNTVSEKRHRKKNNKKTPPVWCFKKNFLGGEKLS